MSYESKPCEMCERMGAPTEGYTLSCLLCGATVCFGHGTLHAKEVHDMTYEQWSKERDGKLARLYPKREAAGEGK